VILTMQRGETSIAEAFPLLLVLSSVLLFEAWANMMMRQLW